MSILGWAPGPAPQVPPGGTPRRTRVGPVVIIVAAAALLGLVAAVIAVVHELASVDHLGVLDDPDVVQAVDDACARMADAVQVAAPPADGSAVAVAGGIRRQNRAITSMIAEVRSLGDDVLDGDHPAQDWLTDWATLVDLRASYADALVRGERPSLSVPMTDGLPMTTRMDEISDCALAAELAEPPRPPP